MRGIRPVLALVLCATTSCAVVQGTWSSWGSSPEGPGGDDRRLRVLMTRGDWAAASTSLDRKGDLRPADRILRSLYTGSVSFYAGDFERSAVALDRAGTLANERFTKSASKGTMALLTSDHALPYVPGHTEWLFIHYYAMLARLGMNDRDGAAVEARRLAWLLERFDDRRDPLDAATRAVMRYVNGAVFEALGEWNDAEVAYRNAAVLGADSSLLRITHYASRMTHDASRMTHDASRITDSTDLVLVIERGFVAHKVAQALLVAVGDSDLVAFATSGTKRSRRHAVRVADRLMVDLSPTPLGSWEYRHGRDWDDASWLRLTWPALHRSSDSWPRPVLRMAGDSAPPASGSPLSADVSDAILADYRRNAPLLLARAVLRAGIKHALEQAAEKAGDDADTKTEKRWAMALSAASLVANALDAADTRSWHLLPGEIRVVRNRVPAGDSTLELSVGGRRHRLGGQSLRPGEVAVRVIRLWNGDDDRTPLPTTVLSNGNLTPVLSNRDPRCEFPVRSCK